MIQLVCIGAGYFARFHLEAWTRMPGVSLKAICDLDLAKAQEAAQAFGIPKVYQDYRIMLDKEEVDIVDIITPPNTHLELVQYAAKKGIHILCQKPLAPSLKEAQQMVLVAKEQGIRLLIHENFRFQPWYRKMKSLIDEGALGDSLHTLTFQMRTGDGWPEDAYLSRQPYFRTMPRLLIYETGIHFIDVFRYLGGEISEVYAKLRRLNPAIRGEDAGIVLFTFASGAQGIYDANRYNEVNHTNPRYTFGKMLLEGNGGSLRLDLDGNLSLKPLGEAEKKISYVHRDIHFAGDCVFACQQHLIQSIQRGEKAETEGDIYVENLVIQEAIYQSNEQNQAMSISI
ncbi:MAG: Gfo/Idh/MocA family oxidoreductase [Bacteroidota bacterium]